MAAEAPKRNATPPATAANGASPVPGRPDGPDVLRAPDEAVATILARDAYTRERHYFLMRLIIWLMIAVLAQSAALLYMATRPPVSRYFATDKDGRIMPLLPINRPISSQTDLSNWVADAVVQCYTLDFANWRPALAKAEENFTPQGWRGFRIALDSSGLLQSIIENKYVTTAVPTGAPVLLDSGQIGNRFAYKLQMPLLVTFQSGSGKTANQTMMVNIIVVRVPETDDPRGLGIAQLIVQ